MTHEYESNAVELTIDDVNQQVNNIFASNDVTPDGPGVDAFWDAVEAVQQVNATAAEELRVLSDMWERLSAAAMDSMT